MNIKEFLPKSFHFNNALARRTRGGDEVRLLVGNVFAGVELFHFLRMHTRDEAHNFNTS